VPFFSFFFFFLFLEGTSRNPNQYALPAIEQRQPLEGMFESSSSSSSFFFFKEKIISVSLKKDDKRKHSYIKKQKALIKS
jgi:hypothetical protein